MARLKLIALLRRVKPTHTTQHLQHWAVTFKHFTERIEVSLLYGTAMLYRSCCLWKDKPKATNKCIWSFLYADSIQKNMMVTCRSFYTKIFQRKNHIYHAGIKKDKSDNDWTTLSWLTLHLWVIYRFYKPEKISNCTLDILLNRPSTILFSA